MAHPHRIQDAGASARRRAAQLRRTEIRHQHRRGLPRAAAAAVAGYLLSIPLQNASAPASMVFALIAGFTIWAARGAYRPGREVRNWRQGAEGERRTAQLLHPLTRRRHGWVVLHDRASGTRANLDHVALAPDGRSALYLDTKTFRNRRARVFLRGGILHCGTYAYKDAVRTVLMEARCAAAALGVPVTPLIVVHGPKIPGGRIRSNDITIVSASVLRNEMTARGCPPDPRAVQQLATRAENTLPRYTAS
ncbi:nuclease-related domain-containing protein [Streptomyces sp. NEAU-S7GS2]|uniref:nuclease-related domain-containing protein n=1 Tax=Streptomyces sp. NEAU-S7GS2 TaxID=2202000 RepID=UPI000D6F55B9|nr:nuclease-related domain-containing protein [Streptomyces sp. NEAU-S7GS2]AWN32610.1 hypothetical protein DKG71_42275 [Streptomyces sp. NEAU-S7GS2]